MTDQEKMALWVKIWKETGPELDRIRCREIKTADTTATILALEDAFQAALLHQKLNPSSGLVEQQRLFQKLRS